MSNINATNITIIYGDSVDVIFTIVYTLILFITLFGCSLVLTLFYMERKNRKIAHNYVISMCIGDIMHGCVGSAVVLHYINGLKVGDDTCHIETALMMATAYMSLFNLVTTAIDRYMSIVHPLKYRVWMTHQLSYGIIVVGWMVGIGFGLGIIGLRSNKYLEVPHMLCLYLTLVVDRVYLFAYIQLLIYLGVIITVIFYIRIYIELRRVFQENLGRNNIMSIVQWAKERQKSQSMSSISDTKSASPQIGFLKIREVRVTLLMFITMITFVSCWIPVVLVVMIFRDDPNFGKVEILITYALPKFYSMINPIFYACTVKDVQNAFKRLVSKIIRRKKDHKMSISSPISSQ